MSSLQSAGIRGSAVYPALERRVGPRLRRVRPSWVFALLAAAATVWLMHEGRAFIFQNDEWDWMLHRRGHSPDVFLKPHNEHLTALPIAVYKVLLALFGARSTFPYRLVDAILATLSATLLFILLARRIGGWAALAPAAVLLVLGPGWNDILWGFQMGYLFSVASGLGALLALESRTRQGDVGAAVLLIIGLTGGSVGIMTLVGAFVLIALGWRETGWRRLWVVGLPAALYALWYLKYGVSSVHLSYVHLIPLYAFNGLSAVAGSLTGLTVPDGIPYFASLDPGRSIATALLIGFALRFLLGGPLSRRFWAATAVATAFWIAAALSYNSGRDANASRYIYAIAPFVILAIAECAHGWRPARGRGVALLYVLAAAAIVSNLSFLRQGALLFDVTSEFARGELGALQVARGVVAPDFHPESPDISAIIAAHNMVPLDAGSYFAAADKFGSPADTVSQLLRRGEPIREAADLVLIKAERINVAPATATTGASCRREAPSRAGIAVSSGPGTLIFASSGARPSQIAVRRFAGAYHFAVFSPLPASRDLAITFPTDRSAMPWHLEFFTSAATLVCRRG
jgi:hypothetical protein